MIDFLYNILWMILMVNLAAMGVLIIFFFNARYNLRRQIIYKNYYIKVVKAAYSAESSEKAAAMLRMNVETFKNFCKQKGLDTPEVRKEKQEKIENKRKDEDERVRLEEEEWRAEQERIIQERVRLQEEDMKKRKERLKKFGM